MRESLRFHLQRDEDETGISGTGCVAYGVQFPDGTCVLRWDTAVNSTTFYASINDVEYLHGHGGRTRIVWDDVPTRSHEIRPESQSSYVDAAGFHNETCRHEPERPKSKLGQCPWTNELGERCKWNVHPGNVHNVLGISGVPSTPTKIAQ